MAALQLCVTPSLQPPCMNEQAMHEIAELTREICGISGQEWDQACMQENRERFLERAAIRRR
jgi:hypothetical protein